MKTIALLLALAPIAIPAFAATTIVGGNTIDSQDFSTQPAKHWKVQLQSPTPSDAVDLAIRFKNPGTLGSFKKDK